MTIENFHRIVQDFVNFPDTIKYKEWSDKIITKKCRMCHYTKYIDNFYKNHHVICKICYEISIININKHKCTDMCGVKSI